MILKSALSLATLYVLFVSRAEWTTDLGWAGSFTGKDFGRVHRDGTLIVILAHHVAISFESL